MKRAALALLALFFLYSPAHAQPQPAAPVRYLVLCMDGVGYDLAVEMHRRGELRNFLPPAPLIVAFPSDTNPALVEILRPVGAPPAEGYEDHYFDPAENKMRGGIFHRFSRKHFVEDNYRGLFDYHPHPIRMTFEYAVPVLGPWLNGALNLGRIKDEFRKSKEPVFFAYFDASDTATHLNGKWLVRRQLREVDRWVGELRAKGETAVEVVVFSDHGNDTRRLRRANLGGPLERAGFRLEGKIRDARSVVLPQFGLVGSAVLYTAPGREAAAAEALRDAKGVDLAVYRDGEAVRVVGPRGRARIERRMRDGEAWFRYVVEVGDPLQLECIAEELASEGFADAEGFIPAEQWLRATAEHIYPDPLRRLWNAFDGLVVHPASVLVSLEDGYYTGSWVLGLFAFLQATHGNLRRAQSRGVILSTTPALFLPDRGPFTGENFLPRLSSLWSPAAPPVTTLLAPRWPLLPTLIAEPPGTCLGEVESPGGGCHRARGEGLEGAGTKARRHPPQD